MDAVIADLSLDAEIDDQYCKRRWGAKQKAPVHPSPLTLNSVTILSHVTLVSCDESRCLVTIVSHDDKALVHPSPLPLSIVVYCQ